MKKPVFNLQFPSHVNEIEVDGYVFQRTTEYGSAFSKLQHLVNSSGSEFETRIQVGSHQPTATVEIPDKEKLCALAWADSNSTALSDIILLLSIFTGRNVFVDVDEDGGVAVMQDHRRSSFGGELCLSMPHVWMCRERRTGALLERSAIEGKSVSGYDQLDLGLEKGLNDLLSLIRTTAWQNKYQGGHFLLLYKQAIQRQIIETSFVLCWAIWEHLFTLHNRSWMSERTIVNLSGEEKIRFVYGAYFQQPSKVASEFAQLVKTRNRIVHYGMPVRPEDNDAMERFVRTTERVVAVILGLLPSFVLEGAEDLRRTLREG
ncbi:MAG: hypothetical protein WC641_08380 [Patescibacteria group bacterium]